MRTIHTAFLAPGERDQIRELLNRAFGERFDEADWNHTLGGLHVLATEGERIIGHGSVVQRQLIQAGRAWRTGYVEGVAVDPQWRGRGHASAIMDEIERIVQAGYELGALSASARVDGMYRARGWLAWQGPTSVLAPHGLERTPEDDDSTYVLLVPGQAELDRAGELTCDWRVGDVW
jgi:aminoglycoside 2'-N-acetyltransferase I